MSLAVTLQRNYQKCLESDLVGNWEQADGSAVLLPIYHSNLRVQKEQVFLIQLDSTGEIIQGDFLNEDEVIIFPVTEDSVSRSSGASSRPLVDEIQYLVPVDDNKQGLYLTLLNEWINFEQNTKVKTFLQIVYDYVASGKLIDDVVRFLSRGYPYQYDEANQELSVEITDEDKVTQKKYKLTKVIIEFEIAEFEGSKNWRVSKSPQLHQSFIKFQEHQNKQLPQDVCAITGETMYCATKHRGMMGNAKIVGVSNNPEAYMGRFRDKADVVKIGYKTSNEIHNMLKYLLESKNTAKRLSYKKGRSGADPGVLLTWFSDDISNQRQTDVTNPGLFFGNLTLSDDDIDYIVGGAATQSILQKAVGFDKRINRDAKVYLMILDKASNGRISIKYFRESSQGQFYDHMMKWYDSFQWYFYDSKSKKHTLQSPSLIRTVETVFGFEQDTGFVAIADSKNKFKENWLTHLIPCVTEGKRIPLGLVQQAIENIRNRQRYDKSWGTVVAVSAAVLKKYFLDYKSREVNAMLDVTNVDRSYLYGRVLALLEYLEQQSLRAQRGEDSKAIRQTNAERFWNNYLQAPAKTMNFLIQRGRPYWERVRKNSPQYFIRAHQELEACINQIGEVEGEKNKNRPLDEEFIFGYYAQRRALYQSKEDKAHEQTNTEEE